MGHIEFMGVVDTACSNRTAGYRRKSMSWLQLLTGSCLLWGLTALSFWWLGYVVVTSWLHAVSSRVQDCVRQNGEECSANCLLQSTWLEYLSLELLQIRTKKLCRDTNWQISVYVGTCTFCFIYVRFTRSRMGARTHTHTHTHTHTRRLILTTAGSIGLCLNCGHSQFRRGWN